MNDMNETKHTVAHAHEAHTVVNLAAMRLVSALVFIVMLAALVVLEIVQPGKPTSSINTSSLGDLLYLAGLITSFVKAVF